MKCAKWAIILLNSLLICSCASVQTRPVHFKNYALGATMKANIGSSMVKNKQAWEVDEGKKWVGIINSPTGWKHVKYYTDESFQEELIFTGRSGDTIYISYREYKKDFARPAFFQELRYDLSKSNRIVFKQYRIEVVEATNEYIKYVVTAD